MPEETSHFHRPPLAGSLPTAPSCGAAPAWHPALQELSTAPQGSKSTEAASLAELPMLLPHFPSAYPNLGPALIVPSPPAQAANSLFPQPRWALHPLKDSLVPRSSPAIVPACGGSPVPQAVQPPQSGLIESAELLFLFSGDNFSSPPPSHSPSLLQAAHSALLPLLKAQAREISPRLVLHKH